MTQKRLPLRTASRVPPDARNPISHRETPSINMHKKKESSRTQTKQCPIFIQSALKSYKNHTHHPTRTHNTAPHLHRQSPDSSLSLPCEATTIPPKPTPKNEEPCLASTPRWKKPTQ